MDCMNLKNIAYVHTELCKDVEIAKHQHDFAGVTDFYGMKVAVKRNAVRFKKVGDRVSNELGCDCWSLGTAERYYDYSF